MSSRIIILEAAIAAGKSTLGRSIANYYNSKGIKAKYFPEFFNKSLLDYYIGNMKEQAYNFQITMIRERVNVINKAIRKIKEGKYKVAVIDRGIMGDLCFAKMLCDDGYISLNEYRIYAELATSTSVKKFPKGVKVDVLYLKSDPKILLKRVKKRGIESEITGYNIEYMTNLSNMHDLICSGNVDKLDKISRHILDFHGQHFKVKILNYDTDLSSDIFEEVLSNAAVEKILEHLNN